MVESQPSKLLVASSILVSRSNISPNLPLLRLYDGTTASHFPGNLSGLLNLNC